MQELEARVLLAAGDETGDTTTAGNKPGANTKPKANTNPGANTNPSANARSSMNVRSVAKSNHLKDGAKLTDFVDGTNRSLAKNVDALPKNLTVSRDLLTKMDRAADQGAVDRKDLDGEYRGNATRKANGSVVFDKNVSSGDDKTFFNFHTHNDGSTFSTTDFINGAIDFDKPNNVIYSADYKDDPVANKNAKGSVYLLNRTKGTPEWSPELREELSGKFELEKDNGDGTGTYREVKAGLGSTMITRLMDKGLSFKDAQFESTRQMANALDVGYYGTDPGGTKLKQLNDVKTFDRGITVANTRAFIAKNASNS